MNSFSRLSLYDFLAILIPGFVILWFFDHFNLNIACPVTGILIAVLSYLTGLCYHKLIELLVTITNVRRSKKMQEKAWKKFYNGIGFEKEFPKNIDEAFVQSYYKIAKEGCLMNIPVLEAQETFLRNIIPLLLVSIPIILVKHKTFDEKYCLCVLLLLLFISSAFLWYKVSIKIYYLVWEGNHYLKKLNYEKTSD